MKTIFVLLVASLFVGAPCFVFGAHASEANGNTACPLGCKNEPAPGEGTGVSRCFVTFVAPPGGLGMKVQIVDRQGFGVLRNKRGKRALRGSVKSRRVSVDCSAILAGVRLRNCVYLRDYPDRTPHVRNGDAVGAEYRKLFPFTHHAGGVDVQL